MTHTIKVTIRGDVEKHKRRMAEEGDGLIGILKSGKCPGIVLSKDHPDPVTKAHASMAKIEKFVKERPDFVTAGFKSEAAYRGHFGRAWNLTKNAQQGTTNEGAKASPMVGRVDRITFNRKVREAGGPEILKDKKAAKELFKEYRWDQ